MNTETNSLTQLETRLRRVERQNRLLLTLVVGGGVFACFAGSPTTPIVDEVKARRFVLVDDKDKTIGTWASKNGFASLAFDKDQFGNATVRIEEEETGGGVTLFSNGNGRAFLTANNVNGARLGLSHVSSPSSSDYISLLAAGGPTVAIGAANRSRLMVSPGASIPVTFYGPGGQRRVLFGSPALELFGPKLQLRDTRGNLIQELPDNRSKKRK